MFCNVEHVPDSGFKHEAHSDVSPSFIRVYCKITVKRVKEILP